MSQVKEMTSGGYLGKYHWQKVKYPSGKKEYIPKLIDISPDPKKEHQKKWRQMKCLLVIFLLLIIGIVLAAILVPLLLLREKAPQTSLSTTVGTTRKVNCVYPSVLNVDGTCVNVMIDRNNCGSLGNICLNNLTCSAGICANVPGIELNNSIAIWLSSINGSADDQMFNVTLPFPITLYNMTTDRVIVTTDGVLCLGGCSTSYTETRLPASAFTHATAFPFWDDLYIYSNTSQGIYYQSEGISPTRRLIFEYYMSHYLQPNQFYHFQILFFENFPGIVQFKYFQATDGGDTCTIGVQASNNGPFLLYSYDQLNSVQENLLLTFDTNLARLNRSSMTNT